MLTTVMGELMYQESPFVEVEIWNKIIVEVEAG
jgi:hypothetical protein